MGRKRRKVYGLVDITRHVQRALSRGENYHQLRRGDCSRISAVSNPVDSRTLNAGLNPIGGYAKTPVMESPCQ
jgi:hypothetical protein